MYSWLREIINSKDFWISFSVAVIFLLAGKLSVLVAGFFRQLRQSHQSYSVSGFWIGDCVLPSHKNKYLVEIWRIVQKQDQIKLYLYAYSPIDNSIDKCSGSGIFRGSYLSAIYYSIRRESYESGVLALKLNKKGLRGTYAQYDVGDVDEKLYVSDGEYTLTRLKLPFFKTVKIALGFPPFKDFEEAHQTYEICCPQKKNILLNAEQITEN